MARGDLRDETWFSCLPLFHSNAQVLCAYPALLAGARVAYVERFSGTRFWQQVITHRATQTCLVAMQLRTVLAQPPAAGERDHQVRRLFFPQAIVAG